MENIENNKVFRNILKYTVIFYEDKPEPNTFGSNTISYELYWDSVNGILHVTEIGPFGDGILVARYQDRHNRGITLNEMLENIKEISQMTYKEFKEKVLQQGDVKLSIEENN